MCCLFVCVCLIALYTNTCTAKKKEVTSSLKKASKAYTKLEEEEEQYKSQMASCETRDVRARQASGRRDSFYDKDKNAHLILDLISPF